MKSNAFASALVATTLGFSAAASANIIDLFDDPLSPGINYAIDTTVGGGGSVSSFTTGGTGIIGSNRDLFVELVSSNGGTSSAAIEVASGSLGFSSTTGDVGTASVQWDGSANTSAVLDTTVGLGGLSLINQTGCPVTGCNMIQAMILDADLAFEYQIGVYSSATKYSILTSGSIFEIDSGNGDPAYLSNYFFSWFTSLGEGYQFEDGLPFYMDYGPGGAADFNSVTALELVINSNSGFFGASSPFPGFAPTQKARLDLGIGEITKVPEPASLSLVGLALVGLAGLRRRRQQV